MAAELNGPGDGKDSGSFKGKRDIPHKIRGIEPGRIPVEPQPSDASSDLAFRRALDKIASEIAGSMTSVQEVKEVRGPLTPPALVESAREDLQRVAKVPKQEMYAIHERHGLNDFLGNVARSIHMLVQTKDDATEIVHKTHETNGESHTDDVEYVLQRRTGRERISIKSRGGSLNIAVLNMPENLSSEDYQRPEVVLAIQNWPLGSIESTESSVQPLAFDKETGMKYLPAKNPESPSSQLGFARTVQKFVQKYGSVLQ